MATKSSTDRFSNVAFGHVTMSAANTLTFEIIQMGVTVFQKMAMILHRILFYPTPAALRELVAASDEMQMALTSTNRLSSVADITDPAVIAMCRLVSIGVAVATYATPIIVDLTGLPGGGKLIAGNPLYAAMQTTGAVAASEFRCQLDFTWLELSDTDYLELMQAQYPANIA